MRLAPLLTTLLTLTSIAAQAGPDGGTVAVKECFRGGCNQELCTDRSGAVSACLWRPRYRCFKDAKCARQADGHCDFTPTAELKRCLTAEDAKGSAGSDVQ